MLNKKPQRRTCLKSITKNENISDSPSTDASNALIT